MAWQNQPGQAFPGHLSPSVQSFIGQHAQPLPGAFQASLPAYSGVAYPQQPATPPEVIAAAQAAGLGMPTREYRKTTSGSSLIASALPSFMGASLIASLISGGVIMVMVCGIILFTVPAPFNLIGAGSTIVITAVSILPFWPMLMRLTKGTGAGGKKTFVAWSCPEGLVYALNNNLNTVRWSDIKQIWRTTGMLNGILTTLGYRVEPNNAPPFSFSMLNGPFADMVLNNNTSGSMSVSFGGGEISNQGGFIQVAGNFALAEYAGLGELIEEQATQQILPRMIEAYHAGSVLNFGPFVVRQQGVSDGTRELTWAEVERIQVSTTAIQITRKPANMICFTLSAATLPNFALLCAVLNTLQEKNA